MPPTLSPAAAVTAYEVLCSTMLTKGGVDTNPRESVFFSRDPRALDALGPILESKGIEARRATNIALLGVPIGSNDFCAAYIADRLAYLHQKIGRIVAYDQLQTACHMARYSLNSTFTHIMRCSDYLVTKGHAANFDQLSTSTCAILLGHGLDSFQAHQASLHMDSSGLHFARARSTLPCAFIAACARLRFSFHRVFPATSGGDVDFFSSFLHCPGAANFNAGITKSHQGLAHPCGRSPPNLRPQPDLTL